MKRYMMLFVSCALCATVFSQTAKPKPPDASPPQVLKEEIERRGNMVQEIGVIKAGPIDVIAEALAPPADDSDKWYLTVVTTKGDPASARLVNDFLTTEPLQAWANVGEPEKSYSHYQVRQWEDVTQKDWFAPIADYLKAGFKDIGAPALIIQPPRNGQYGPNAAVVGMFFGYEGDSKKLSNKIGETIKQFTAEAKLTSAEVNGVYRIAAPGNPHIQVVTAHPLDTESTAAQGGRTAPFAVPTPNRNTYDIPPAKLLSPSQIRMYSSATAPDAFVMLMMENGVTSADDVQRSWLAWVQSHPQDANPMGPGTPAVGAPSISIWLTLANMLITSGGVGTMLMMWRNITPKKLLTDQQFQVLQDQLAMFQTWAKNPGT